MNNTKESDLIYGETSTRFMCIFDEQKVKSLIRPVGISPIPKEQKILEDTKSPLEYRYHFLHREIHLRDEDETGGQIINELVEMHQQVNELETSSIILLENRGYLIGN